MTHAPTPLADHHNRLINYLRISITDRCNFRCQYCMPTKGIPLLNHADILTYEDILRCARIAISLGLRKIRVTGGEPLVRRGVVSLLAELSRLPDLADLSLTTNGALLGHYAAALRAAGLHRVNVSLDTLRPERFATITRQPVLTNVLEGIRAAEAAGLHPVKLNVVTMRSVNLDEIADFAAMTLHHAYEVRFIELMPVGGHAYWDSAQLVPGEEVLQILSKRYELAPLDDPAGAPVSGRLFQIRGAAGRIGLISPMTDHFCRHCNRLRLTPDGKLRTCLFHEAEVDLRRLLRGGVDDEALAGVFRSAVAQKPAGPAGGIGGGWKCTSAMSRIGG
ncbi:MAG TPA: GTP 3',8-cyclase MoaA [Acidobacteriota bacterium]|nr:GTP 3',8-cyclase MoaA [Acidobacteriota bacterium]HQF86494.1 GTP 3',8-cyclase MoaA [Acidobacteriota bacterium]HQG90254.1 GTP 3',8-cyclase MoaA [Acidobacteriota bacterium]